MLATKKTSNFGKLTKPRTPKIPVYTDINSVVDAIGRVVLADALGLDRGAVDVAVHRKLFPAIWYRVVKKQAEEKGFEVSLSLFNFIKPAK